MRQRLRSRLSHANVAATLVSLTVLLTSVVALLAFGGVKASAVQSVSCGDTITADTTLHHDLLNCPDKGIIFGADDITLDLNGHTIDGDGRAAGCYPNDPFCDTGVASDRHDGVTVMHGSVRDFRAGVDLERGRHIRVRGISASRNYLCATSRGCPESAPISFGIGFYRAAQSLIRDSSGNGSVPPQGGTGVFLIASHHVRVLDSSFQDNGDRGIGVFDSDHNLIKRNSLSRNTAAGIFFEGSDRNELRRNRFVRDSLGVDLTGNGNVIAKNRISHMIRRSGHLQGVAINVCCSSHNLIARNSIRDTDGTAIKLGAFGGVGNVVRRNHVHGPGNDGVHVVAKIKKKPKHTLLKRNHVFGAKDDGIDATAPTTKLTRNEARRNGDLGIAAVPGVIDGGGNKASGNGDPRQCTNIVCR
jgi:parallel beta-helix repeat protein